MKRYIILLIGVAAVVLAGCQKEFTSSASNAVDKRLNDSINRWYSELQNAPYGWNLWVNTSEGYFKFWMEFGDDLEVEMYSDNEAAASLGFANTGLYSIRGYSLPTLVFETYSLIHIINDPNDEISGGTGNLGLETDFELGILQYRDNTFTMRGRLNDVDAILSKASAEDKNAIVNAAPGKNHLVDMMNRLDSYDEGTYLIAQIGGQDVVFTLNKRKIINLFVKDGAIRNANNDVLLSYDGSVAYVNPLNVGEYNIFGLKWNQATSTYSVVIEKDGVTEEVEFEAVDELPYELPLLFNAGIYDCGYTAPALYPSAERDKAVNPIAYYTDSVHVNLTGRGLPVDYMYYRIYTSPKGEDRFQIYMLLDSRAIAYYDYSVTYIDDKRSQFTIGTKYTEDGVGNASTLDKTWGTTTKLLSYFAGQTFEIRWTNLSWSGYSLGELSSVDRPQTRALMVPDVW